MKLTKSTTFCAGLAFLTVLLGCGGGGGASSAQDLTFQISWPQLSRSGINSPESAQFAYLTFVGAGANGSDVTMQVARQTSPGAYVGTYVVPAVTNPDGKSLTVNFCATNSLTATVATATATVSVSGNSINIANFSLVGKIASVVVQSSIFTYSAGAKPALLFTAKDSLGNVLAVPQGAGHWTQVSGASLSVPDSGVATELSTGPTIVKVSVDGVSSPTASVEINAVFQIYSSWTYSNDTLYDVGFSPDGKTLLTNAKFTTSTDSDFKTWNVAQATFIKGYPLGGTHAEFHPIDNSKVLIAGNTIVATITPTTLDTVTQYQNGTNVRYATYSRDGLKVACCDDNYFTVVDATNQNQLWHLPAWSQGYAAFSTGNSLVAFGGSNLKIFDSSSGTLLKTLGTTSSYSYGPLCFAHNDTLLVAMGLSGANIYDVQSGSLVKTLTFPNNVSSPVKFTLNDEFVVVGGTDGNLYFFDPTSGNLVRKIFVQGRPIVTIDCSPTNRVLAAGTDDRLVGLFCY